MKSKKTRVTHNKYFEMKLEIGLVCDTYLARVFAHIFTIYHLPVTAPTLIAIHVAIES